jgi:ankyrin repeat protein
MTTKQMLLSATLIFGAIANIALAGVDITWFMEQEDKRKQQKMNRELLDAANTGKLKKVKLLLETGADINAENEYKDTALHYNVSAFETDMFPKKTKLAMAEMLIEYGANVNAQNSLHYTPAHYAARSGNRPMLELLAKNGADFTLKSSAGRTPLKMLTRVKNCKANWNDNKEKEYQDAYNFLKPFKDAQLIA